MVLFLTVLSSCSCVPFAWTRLSCGFFLSATSGSISQDFYQTPTLLDLCLGRFWSAQALAEWAEGHIRYQKSYVTCEITHDF